jgi:hypothetical protein
MAIPNILYKAFSDKKHALEFINKGTLKFTVIERYKYLEDEVVDEDRVDITEGSADALQAGEAIAINTESSTQRITKGVEKLHVSTSKGTYVCCFSAPESNNFQDTEIKYGKYIVRIKDPDKLHEDLSTAINANKELSNNLPLLESDYVSYTHGMDVGELTLKEKLKLGWSQKPYSFSSDQEYRLCFSHTSEVNNYPRDRFISIGTTLQYCELITRVGVGN